MQDNCVALLSLQSSICLYILATWRDVSMTGRSWIYCQVDEDRTQLQRKCLELVAAADQTHQQKLCTASHRVNADPPSEDIEALQVTYHFLPRLQGLIMAFLCRTFLHMNKFESIFELSSNAATHNTNEHANDSFAPIISQNYFQDSN